MRIFNQMSRFPVFSDSIDWFVMITIRRLTCSSVLSVSSSLPCPEVGNVGVPGGFSDFLSLFHAAIRL